MDSVGFVGDFSRKPLLVFCLLFLLVCFFLNHFIPECEQKLGLVTANTLVANTYVWNLLTSCFYERSIFKIVIDVCGLLVCSSHNISYSPVDQFALYFVLSILSCTIATSTWCFGRFFFTGIDSILLDPIYGFSGVFIIIIMHARTQLKDTPIISSFSHLTFNNAPIIIVFIQILCYTIGLRFLATDDGSLGESSESLAFVTIYNDPSSDLNTTPLTAPVTHKDVVAERRRAKAMKLLDAKMQELTKESEGWDDDNHDDNDEDGVVVSPSAIGRGTFSV
eukprot:gene9002-18637_t